MILDQSSDKTRSRVSAQSFVVDGKSFLRPHVKVKALDDMPGVPKGSLHLINHI